MEPLTGLTRDKLKEIGLTDSQVKAFRALRTRHGEVTSNLLTNSPEVPDAMRRKLLEWLETSNLDTSPDELGALELKIVPFPPLSGTAAELIITYNAQIDDDTIETFAQDIHLRGPSKHRIHDVSHAHLIEVRIVVEGSEGNSATVLMDRTATPVDTDGEMRDFRMTTGGNMPVVLERQADGFRLVRARSGDVASSILLGRDNASIDFEELQRLFGDRAIPEGMLVISDDDTSLKHSGSWKILPPLREREVWTPDGRTIYASLSVGTFVSADVIPFDEKPSTRFERSGRFRILGAPDARFDHFQLSFAPILADGAETRLASIGMAAGEPGVRKFSNEDPAAAEALMRLSLIEGEVDFEGSFALLASIFEPDGGNVQPPEYAGWAWALTGPVTLIGFQSDSRLLTPRHDIVIVLPSLGDLASGEGVPYNVSEAALLNRPDLFGDDPGTSCRPFDNPGRTLGERRFSTVLRVTQPYVEGVRNDQILPSTEKARPVDYPRNAVGVDNPIDFEDGGMQFQARSVAIGHILEHAVRYRSNGYSLGDVAYSLTLAPRQKRRIMKLDYQRRERASRDEQTFSEDEVADNTERMRDYDNAVEAELNEWARGSSKSKMSAGAAGIGFASGPVVLGGGAVTSSASSASSQSGGRTAAAAETQRLRDSIRRYGQSLRNFGTTVITEMDQSESIEAVSEVVQNINYTRSLSIIYYEILRHIRVDTEIAGVRECVFVPLPVKKFDDQRIVKYAHVLRRYARGWDQRLGLRYAQEAAFGFPANHELPAGERQKQKLDSISGSVFLQIGIAMPEDGDEVKEINKNTDKTVYEREIYQARVSKWLPFAGFMPVPLPLLVEKTISASAEERNRYFQSEIAPHMARRYLDKLKVKNANGDLAADFTLANDYRFGQTVRVDFTVEADGRSREDLKNLTFYFDDKVLMPAKSFVNLTRSTLRYRNAHYSGQARSDTGYRDLIDSATGKPDSNGALTTHPPSSADERDLQEVAKRGFRDFAKYVERETFFFNKAVWWNIDPDELYTLLDGFSVSNEDGRSLASMVQRRPLGIMGNMMVFATSTDRPVDPMFETFDALKAHYLSGLPKSDPMRISLPTEGLYARAHLDGCVAAEEHNGSFDWVFDNQEPELADFPSNMFDSRRAEPQGIAPTDLPDTIINLQNAPAAPNVSGLSDAFGAVQNAGAFRDMAGLAGTQANARAAMQSAAGLATSFGSMAFQQRMAQISADAAAAKDVRAATSAVKHAVDTGGIAPEVGKKALGEFINRRLGEDVAKDVAGNAKSLAERVLDLPAGGSITTATGDGVQTVTRNPSAGAREDEKGSESESERYDYTVSEPMPVVKQESPMSCWAAAMTMLKGWRSADAAPSVTSYVRMLGEPYQTIYASDTGLLAKDKSGLLMAAGLKTLPEGASSLTAQGYLDLLMQHGPIWVTVDVGDEANIAKHAIILRGIVGDRDSPSMRIIDPSDGQKREVPFAEFQARYERIAQETPTSVPLTIQMVVNDLGAAEGQATITTLDDEILGPLTDDEKRMIDEAEETGELGLAGPVLTANATLNARLVAAAILAGRTLDNDQYLFGFDPDQDVVDPHVIKLAERIEGYRHVNGLARPISPEEWAQVFGVLEDGGSLLIQFPGTIEGDHRELAAWLLVSRVGLDTKGENELFVVPEAAESDPRLDTLDRRLRKFGPLAHWANIDRAERLHYIARRLVDVYNFSEIGASAISGSFWSESGGRPAAIEADRGRHLKAPHYISQTEGGRVVKFTPEQIARSRHTTHLVESEERPWKPGVGLAQWTPWDRRDPLFQHAYQGVVLGPNILFSIDAQIDYLVNGDLFRNKLVPENSNLTIEEYSDHLLEKFFISRRHLDGGTGAIRARDLRRDHSRAVLDDLRRREQNG